MKAKDKKLEEAVRFFQAEEGFHRLLLRMIEKYRSLGRIGGSVRITNLSKQEAAVLSSFFRKEMEPGQEARVLIKEFERFLQESRFSHIHCLELLEGFAGEKLMSKREQKERNHNKKQLFFQQIQEKFSSSFVSTWIRSILSLSAETRLIHHLYEQQQDRLAADMMVVANALVELEKKKGSNGIVLVERMERFPFFAERITGNPHGFDLHTTRGKMLFNALRVIGTGSYQGEVFRLKLTQAEENNQLLHSFGLLRDDILNFVTTTGLLALDHESRPLAVWKAAIQERCVLNIPLKEMVKVRRVKPANSKLRKVFVLENSGLFSALFEALIKEGIHPPLICTHGQINTCSLILLDQLASNGTCIYYSGDFDPEGLLIADRLDQRYPGRVILWRFSAEDYQACRLEQVLEEYRIKKLKNIKSPKLVEVASAMSRLRQAGYQESLFQFLLEDIRREIVD
ncbi:TIGR02679 family protein [Paenactinomyces guangxiensis]|uniref:TIGR02679 family protein n=1 Tax=Paenactinomyces guangxiensis TaxID=1490290 RepID=A0A7W1WP16_9BACL|nr:TIGR02679 family protein [Paenactinomyces guangxiensis]MBA4493434.1 TIGR02679 family protein [Paenactinomyces guangxiensis]MBH8590525.1 TIGR02679 family protein [Paenactinomyces guangxiensis]